jgi:hypothetical protein
MRVIQLVTGKDNKTLDLGRCSWVVSMLAVIGAAGMNWWRHESIDLAQLAQALGTIAGAHGLALWAKKDTEPECKP